MPLIKPGQDVSKEIIDAINSESISIDDGDVIAIAQKIISKSENRYLDISQLKPSEEAITLSTKIDKDPKQILLNYVKHMERKDVSDMFYRERKDLIQRLLFNI